MLRAGAAAPLALARGADLLPYGGPAALATIAWTGFRNGDYAIIGAVLGPAQAGFYWRAYQLAVEYQGKVAVAMAQIAFPVLARTPGPEEMLALRQRMVRLLDRRPLPAAGAAAAAGAGGRAVAVRRRTGSRRWLPTQILVLGGAATLAINACGLP